MMEGWFSTCKCININPDINGLKDLAILLEIGNRLVGEFSQSYSVFGACSPQAKACL